MITNTAPITMNIVTPNTTINVVINIKVESVYEKVTDIIYSKLTKD